MNITQAIFCVVDFLISKIVLSIQQVNNILFYTAPTVVPTKPGIYSVLKHCPDTVHCMTTCRNGYILDGGSTGCPRCSCNQGMKHTDLSTPNLGYIPWMTTGEHREY